MYWATFQKELDDIRVQIRSVKDPKAHVNADDPLVERLRKLCELTTVPVERKTLSLEIGEDGQPIIPPELVGFFQAAGTKTQPGTVQQEVPKGKEMRATVLPRETLHINHPPVLEEATEQSVDSSAADIETQVWDV